MKQNKKVVRLTESKLKSLIAESIKEVLKEHYYDDLDDFNMPNKWFDKEAKRAAMEDGAMEADSSDDFKCKYTSTDKFRNGLLLVKRKGRYNFVDTDNKLLSPNLWFSNARGFGLVLDGYAIVRIGLKWYLIDTNGDIYDRDTEEPLGKNVKDLTEPQEYDYDF